MIVEKLLQLPHLYVKQNNKQKTICCDPDEIRTHDPQFSILLYISIANIINIVVVWTLSSPFQVGVRKVSTESLISKFPRRFLHHYIVYNMLRRSPI
jgi:hypothetical protein